MKLTHQVGTARPVASRATLTRGARRAGSTPLHTVAGGERDAPAIVDQLVEHGAELEFVTQDGLTPLMRACERGNECVALQLIRLGANVTRRHAHVGWQPLHYAASSGQRKAVAVVLDALAARGERDGVDVTTSDLDASRTPLHLACGAGRVEVVQLLLDCGADASVEDAIGNTPLMVATRRSHVPVVRLLSQRGARHESFLDALLQAWEGTAARAKELEAGLGSHSTPVPAPPDELGLREDREAWRHEVLDEYKRMLTEAVKEVESARAGQAEVYAQLNQQEQRVSSLQAERQAWLEAKAALDAKLATAQQQLQDVEAWSLVQVKIVEKAERSRERLLLLLAQQNRELEALRLALPQGPRTGRAPL